MYNQKELCLGWAARTLITALGMLVGFTLLSSPANAQTEPSGEQIEDASSNQIKHAYSNDPLKLIAYSEETHAYSTSSSRPDIIEVYICDTGGEWEPDLGLLVNQLVETSDYFRWLSGGLYVPKFVMMGTVDSAKEQDCHTKAKERSTSRSNSRLNSEEITGAIVMTDTNFVTSLRSGNEVWGWGGAGFFCVRGSSSCNYPENDRDMKINSNIAPNGVGNQSTNTLVHELGHMLAFPHSFSVAEPVNEYDNAMDIMSGGKKSIRFGTLAVNRYAAGWIPQEQVKVYPVSEGTLVSGALYDLMPLGQPGWQMLVLPVKPGKFYALGARVKSGYDDDIPSEGVEVYLIDQSESECDNPIRGVCMGVRRRTKPVVAAGSSVGQLGHVYDKGEVIVLDDTRGVRVRVLEQTADGSGYTVWVGPGPLEGRFLDDEGSPHEMSINWLATTSITEGCDGKNKWRFCPQNEVTRAQMAVFLARFLDLTVTADDKASTAGFNDVNSGAWYAGHLNALGSIASGYDDGTFRPRQPITRGEMAIMLNRALALDSNGDRDTVDFTDVPPGTELATASANLDAAKITEGSTSCRNSSGSGRLFCPDESLTRAQMAAFLYRSQDFRDLSSDDDDEETDGREIRISWGTDASGRDGCPQGAVCRNYYYEYPSDFGQAPYTLECWVNDERRWGPGTWFGDPERGCWVSGSDETVSHVVINGVPSNKLSWLQSNDDKRAIRISVGKPSTRCPRNENCWGLHRDYHYDWSGDFGPGPYTLECWARTSGGKWHLAGKLRWSGDSAEGCYSWGESGQQTVYVVVDGVRSNELRWSRSDDDGRRVQISWEEADLRSDPRPGIRNDCLDFTFCRAFSHELIGDFGPGPHTLECYIGERRWPSITLNGKEVCRARGNYLIVAHVAVDGVRSNELRWPRSDDDGRRVQISWEEADLRSDPRPGIRNDCLDFTFCRAFSHELIGDFGPGPHTLECYIGERRWPSITLNGKEVCRARGNYLIVAHVTVDGVPSNKLRWP